MMGGTVVPVETTRSTALPGGSVVPARGVEPETKPIGIEMLLALEVTPTVRLAATIAADAAAGVKPMTPGTVANGLGTGIVMSENCSSSTLRSVSVPVDKCSPLNLAGLSKTVTVPFALSVMSYSSRGLANTAVSQLSGVAAPQSGGGVGGVMISRTIVMLPGLSRCGSE